MVVKTFEATVAHGRLQHDEPLEFEARRVRVTVIGDEVPGAAARPEKPEFEPTAAERDEPEPPEWLHVETDTYVRMPVKERTLKDVKIIHEGRARPCIILPGELPFE